MFTASSIRRESTGPYVVYAGIAGCDWYPVGLRHIQHTYHIQYQYIRARLPVTFLSRTFQVKLQQSWREIQGMERLLVAPSIPLSFRVKVSTLGLQGSVKASDKSFALVSTCLVDWHPVLSPTISGICSGYFAYECKTCKHSGI